MAVTIFVSWCTYVGLTLHAARPSGIGLAASDVALTVGMAICGHTEADQGTRRYVGLVQLLAAVSMVFGGAGRLLEAAGVVPVVSNLLVVSHLASCGALAFLVLATVRRMKLNGERRTTSNVDLEQLPPGPFAIN
jgi:hypothetical protein